MALQLHFAHFGTEISARRAYRRLLNQEKYSQSLKYFQATTVLLKKALNWPNSSDLAGVRRIRISAVPSGP